MSSPEAAGGGLRVLGRAASINVRKVLWTCAELGLAVERVDPGAGARSSEPSLVALNPNALVPVLLDDDFVLWESNAICRYLTGRERRHDLLPEAPRARAGVEQWMDWQATELNNAWRHAFMNLVRHSPAHADPGATARSAADWNRHMSILDRQLDRTGAWVCGASFTLADIVLGLSCHRWRMTPIDRPELTAVDAWSERLNRRAAFRLHAAEETP